MPIQDAHDRAEKPKKKKPPKGAVPKKSPNKGVLKLPPLPGASSSKKKPKSVVIVKKPPKKPPIPVIGTMEQTWEQQPWQPPLPTKPEKWKYAIPLAEQPKKPKGQKRLPREFTYLTPENYLSNVLGVLDTDEKRKIERDNQRVEKARREGLKAGRRREQGIARLLDKVKDGKMGMAEFQKHLGKNQSIEDFVQHGKRDLPGTWDYTKAIAKAGWNVLDEADDWLDDIDNAALKLPGALKKVPGALKEAYTEGIDPYPFMEAIDNALSVPLDYIDEAAKKDAQQAYRDIREYGVIGGLSRQWKDLDQDAKTFLDWTVGENLTDLLGGKTAGVNPGMAILEAGLFFVPIKGLPSVGTVLMRKLLGLKAGQSIIITARQAKELQRAINLAAGNIRFRKIWHEGLEEWVDSSIDGYTTRVGKGGEILIEKVRKKVGAKKWVPIKSGSRKLQEEEARDSHAVIGALRTRRARTIGELGRWLEIHAPEEFYALRVIAHNRGPAVEAAYHRHQARLLEEAGVNDAASQHIKHADLYDRVAERNLVFQDEAKNWHLDTDYGSPQLQRIEKLWGEQSVMREAALMQMGILGPDTILRRIDAPAAEIDLALSGLRESPARNRFFESLLEIDENQAANWIQMYDARSLAYAEDIRRTLDDQYKALRAKKEAGEAIDEEEFALLEKYRHEGVPNDLWYTKMRRLSSDYTPEDVAFIKAAHGVETDLDKLSRYRRGRMTSGGKIRFSSEGGKAAEDAWWEENGGWAFRIPILIGRQDGKIFVGTPGDGHGDIIAAYREYGEDWINKTYQGAALIDQNSKKIIKVEAIHDAPVGPEVQQLVERAVLQRYAAWREAKFGIVEGDISNLRWRTDWESQSLNAREPSEAAMEAEEILASMRVPRPAARLDRFLQDIVEVLRSGEADNFNVATYIQTWVEDHTRRGYLLDEIQRNEINRAINVLLSTTRRTGTVTGPGGGSPPPHYALPAIEIDYDSLATPGLTYNMPTGFQQEAADIFYNLFRSVDDTDQHYEWYKNIAEILENGDADSEKVSTAIYQYLQANPGLSEQSVAMQVRAMGILNADVAAGRPGSPARNFDEEFLADEVFPEEGWEFAEDGAIVPTQTQPHAPYDETPDLSLRLPPEDDPNARYFLRRVGIGEEYLDYEGHVGRLGSYWGFDEAYVYNLYDKQDAQLHLFDELGRPLTDVENQRPVGSMMYRWRPASTSDYYDADDIHQAIYVEQIHIVGQSRPRDEFGESNLPFDESARQLQRAAGGGDSRAAEERARGHRTGLEAFLTMLHPLAELAEEKNLPIATSFANQRLRKAVERWSERAGRQEWVPSGMYKEEDIASGQGPLGKNIHGLSLVDVEEGQVVGDVAISGRTPVPHQTLAHEVLGHFEQLVVGLDPEFKNALVEAGYMPKSWEDLTEAEAEAYLEKFAGLAEAYVFHGGKNLPVRVRSAFAEISEQVRSDLLKEAWGGPRRAPGRTPAERELFKFFDDMHSWEDAQNLGQRYAPETRGPVRSLRRGFMHLRKREGEARGFWSGKGPMTLLGSDPATMHKFKAKLMQSGYFIGDITRGIRRSGMQMAKLMSFADARKALVPIAEKRLIPTSTTDVPIRLNVTHLDRQVGRQSGKIRKVLDILHEMEIDEAQIDPRALEDFSEETLKRVGDLLSPGMFPEGITAAEMASRIMQSQTPIEGIGWVTKQELEAWNLMDPAVVSQAHKVWALEGAGKLFDAMNGWMRLQILFLNPAYYPMNFIGNGVMNLMQQGVFYLPNTRLALSISENLGEDYGHMVDSIMGTGVAESLGFREAGPDEAIRHFFNNMATRLVDTIPRRASFFHEARRMGFNEEWMVKGLLDAADQGEETAQKVLSVIVRRAKDAIVDYDRLNGFEKSVVSRLIFFYPWIRGATRWTAQFPLKHPVQASAYAALLAGQQVAAQHQIGDRPWYMDLSVPLPFSGPHGSQYFINPRQAFTFTTPWDLLKTGIEFTPGLKDVVPGGGQPLAEMATPVLGAVLTALMGQRTFDDQSVPMDLGTALNEYLALPPLVHKLAAIFAPADSDWHGIRGPQSDNTNALYPRATWNKVLNVILGSLSPTPVNKDKANWLGMGKRGETPRHKMDQWMKEFEEVYGRKPPKEIVDAVNAKIEWETMKERGPKDEDSDGDGNGDTISMERLEKKIDLAIKYNPALRRYKAQMLSDARQGFNQRRDVDSAVESWLGWSRLRSDSADINEYLRSTR